MFYHSLSHHLDLCAYSKRHNCQELHIHLNVYELLWIKSKIGKAVDVLSRCESLESHRAKGLRIKDTNI